LTAIGGRGGGTLGDNKSAICKDERGSRKGKIRLPSYKWRKQRGKFKVLSGRKGALRKLGRGNEFEGEKGSKDGGEHW